MNSIHETSSQGGSNVSLPDTDGNISNDVINFMDDDDSAAFEAQSAASSDHGHFLFDLELLPEDIQLEAEDDLEANNEDDSSGTLMSVYSLEVPHPLNEPAPPNPIQAGVNHFLQQHPACQLITMPLGAFFDVIDVPADGHCAYHCFMGWLSFFGTPFLGTLAMFRNAIYIHLSRNLSANVNERPYRDAAGEVLPDFRGLRRSVIGEVLGEPSGTVKWISPYQLGWLTTVMSLNTCRSFLNSFKETLLSTTLKMLPQHSLCLIWKPIMLRC